MEEHYKVTHKEKNREVMLKADSSQAVIPRTRSKVLTMVSQHIVGKKHVYFKVSAIVAAGILAMMLILYTMANIFPYAIKVNGKTMCYVRGEAGVKHTYNKVIDTYLPKDTELKAVSLGGSFSSERIDISRVKRDQIISASKAADILIEMFEDRDNPLKFTIASVKVQMDKYKPEPKYVKGKNLIVGETKIKKKGRRGKQKVTTTYISVNGKVISKEITGRQVVDEGVPDTVYKGILGLPKGEDWRTYDGDPIYKNGKELVKTAMNYRGAPYKYGGYSLTKGIDCVQFVRQMYAKYGIKLPNGHYGLQHSGVGVKYKNAKKGDIICYGNHVGIYIGNGKMINAVRRGVSISKVKTGRIKAVRRVVK